MSCCSWKLWNSPTYTKNRGLRVKYAPGKGFKQLDERQACFTLSTRSTKGETRLVIYIEIWYGSIFTQNAELLDLLLATQGTLLVEASPIDKIWGVGMELDTPELYIPSKWKGENLLGFILTQLREDILNKRAVWKGLMKFRARFVHIRRSVYFRIWRSRLFSYT